MSMWSSSNSRSIASAGDCQSILQEIISPSVQVAKDAKATAANEATEGILKIKNNIWNKIITSKEFDNFNDQEYFRWIEIYKDSANDLTKVNPVSIEQKMALIEVINTRLLPTPLYTEKNLTAEIQKLNAYKLRKLQNHLGSLDLSSNLIRENLNEFAADLMLILKGPPVSLLDYFTANKSERMSARLMRTVQEDMLIMGLKGMLERIPEKESYTRLERGRYLVKRFFQYKIWKYLVLPYDIPWVDRVRIPDELMEKILVDGLDAHNQELIDYLVKQNMIDHYERFRKVYKPLAFSVGFYFYYDKFSNKFSGKVNENQEEERKRLIADFSRLGRHVIATSDVPDLAEDVIKQEQLKRVLNKFKEKNGSDPTPEEYQEIQNKIFGITENP